MQPARGRAASRQRNRGGSEPPFYGGPSEAGRARQGKKSPKPQGAVNTMWSLLRVSVALAAASFSLGHAAHKPHHHPKPIDPMAQLAAKHGWGAAQVRYEWDVLWRESRSTSGHLNLWATNGHCWGSGQLSDVGSAYGATAVYRYYGGNYATVRGQETADLNYIVRHGYGTPEHAWEHELAYGWY